MLPSGLKWLLVTGAALFTLNQPPTLEARFIGNMAFAISDGVRTIMTDFPYESGYSAYMTYDSREVRSATAETLSLITHRHGDHWEPRIFRSTNWQVAGPDEVTQSLPRDRVLLLNASTSFGPVRIESLRTPHSNLQHFSYVVTWHGRRMYFSGDTDDATHLAKLNDLDVAFLSPWLYRAALKTKTLSAKQVVIYHHELGEVVSECRASCIVPKQGEVLKL